jgi:uncharacterized membrane protein YeaQ/YmgE (transglycosylase-associated protein family)
MGELLLALTTLLVIGLIAGFVAKTGLPRPPPIGLVGMMTVSLAGALLSGTLLSFFRNDGLQVRPARLIGAILVLWLYGQLLQAGSSAGSGGSEGPMPSGPLSGPGALLTWLLPEPTATTIAYWLESRDSTRTMKEWRISDWGPAEVRQLRSSGLGVGESRRWAKALATSSPQGILAERGKWESLDAAERWILAHPWSPDTAWRWAVTGLDVPEAWRCERAGISPSQASAWVHQGFRFPQMMRWIEAGCSDPELARGFEDTGIRPAEAVSWHRLLRAMAPSTVATWRDRWQGVEEAERWSRAHGGSIETAWRWRARDFTLTTSIQRARILPADVAARWRDAGFYQTPETVILGGEIEVPPSQVLKGSARWSVEEARRWVEAVVAPPAEAWAWRAELDGSLSQAKAWRRLGARRAREVGGVREAAAEAGVEDAIAFAKRAGELGASNLRAITAWLASDEAPHALRWLELDAHAIFRWRRLGAIRDKTLFNNTLRWGDVATSEAWTDLADRDLDTAGRWHTATGGDAREAMAWRRATFDDPDEVSAWRDLDVSPATAGSWKTAGFPTPADAGPWEMAGHAPQDAAGWRSAVGEPSAADQWRRFGFGRPAEALGWTRAGVTDPSRARELATVGVDAATYAALAAQHVGEALRRALLEVTVQQAGLDIAGGVITVHVSGETDALPRLRDVLDAAWRCGETAGRVRHGGAPLLIEAIAAVPGARYVRGGEKAQLWERLWRGEVPVVADAGRLDRGDTGPQELMSDGAETLVRLAENQAAEEFFVLVPAIPAIGAQDG